MSFVQIAVQNPDASAPLLIPVWVLPNTSDEVIAEHVRANGALALPWLHEVEPHDGIAVICGGGPSLSDHLSDIAVWSATGTVFGLNAAAIWLKNAGVRVDYQLILDPKEETSALVEDRASERLFCSQVHPETAKYATSLFHLANDGIEDLLPPERVALGGYTLVGGGVSVGITALTVAYTLGFRKLHLYGYDSSNRAGETHASSQPMNALIPQVDVPWGGRVYRASMPMKLQAEAFLRFGAALQDAGCEITVHGDGLLPAMWSIPPLNEREKYQRAWALPAYREWSPGEDRVDDFIAVAKPDGPVIDFGCGTGRAAVAIRKRAGQSVTMIDFTDNCRDQEAFALPFLQWDLSEPIPVQAPYGYCSDVMEHIPPGQVAAVIRNIMAAAPRTFFQIATFPDSFGKELGYPLHLSVHPHEWWAEQFADYDIEWQADRGAWSCFYVTSKES